MGALYNIETSVSKLSIFLLNLQLSDTAMKQTLAKGTLVSELFMQVSLYLCKCSDQNNDERRGEYYDHYNHYNFVLLLFLPVNQSTYRILREGYFIANILMLSLLKILRHL